MPGSGFQHDLAGGNGKLIAPAIQSPNFVHGLQGWTINKDGSAEFHDISIPTTPGFVATFGSTPPANPEPGDIWYDTSNGLLEHQWDGASWIAYTIGTGAIGPGAVTAEVIATETITETNIAPGAITTPKLAAGAVTAANIAAGTVVAGIIDGTVIEGNTIEGSQFRGNNFLINQNGIFYYQNGI